MKKIILFLVVCSFSYVLQAQERSNRTEIKQPIKENINPVKQKKFKSSALLSLSPSQIIGGTAYPDLSLNFAPQSNLRAAGDVNKDGFQDFYYSVLAADEQTEDLSDQILKTKLLYGSATGLSDENSDYFIDSTSIFKNGLRLIDDLTGDDIVEGFVLSDGKLTIYSDASGGNLTQIESMEILTDLSGFPVIKSFGDFNNDGFNDILVFKNQIIAAESNKYHVIYGGANLSDFTVKTIINDKVSNSSTFFQQVLYSDLEGDGTTEIVQLVGLQSQNTAKIYTFQLEENDALSAIDTLDFPQTFGNVASFRSSVYSVVDLNNDGSKELLTYVFDRTYIFEYDTTSSENTFVVSSYNEFFGNGFSVIGDYNDDGFTDLLIAGEPYNIVLGNADLDLNSFTPSLGEGSFSGITSLANNSGYSGDVNGDGIDDLVLEFSEDGSYGYRTYFGNNAVSFSNISEIEYSSPFLPYEYSYYTLNAGDLNGDGTDDYAIEYYGSPSNDNAFPRLEVFYGGDLSKSTPDLVISHPERYRLSAPASGDFNGDGFSDIVINYENETSGINIYFGGTNMDNKSDYELTFSQMFPGELGENWSDEAFEAPANAGDINNDGVDDLIFSANQVQEKTYILFGGSSISTNPDLEIDYFATNFVSLKDFDGDGINDIALSFFVDNIINIYSGFDSENGGSFSQEPIISIMEPFDDGENVLTYLGLLMDSGDYNGDGFSDLIATPFQHYLSIDFNVGVESHHIYLGSADPDSDVDHKFGLKTALFTGEGNTTQTSELLDGNLGELTTVPDQNGDGADEILVGSTPQNFGFETNAVIYFGASDITQINTEGDILFEAPNQRLGIGVHNNNILAQSAHSAVGDFDGDGKNDFLFTQGPDPNFVKDPVYVFSSNEFAVGKEDEITQIKDFRLSQNYPNPFNPSTNISYSIPQTSNVSLKVYDVTGRLVSILVNSRQASGTYDVSLNASSWASGIYFYRIVAGDYVKTRKLTLIK